MISIDPCRLVSSCFNLISAAIRPRYVCWPSLIAVLVVVVGCQQSPYELAPVHGTVTIDGQPFTHGKVMFAPVASGDDHNPGKPAFGRLQADGSFALGTYVDDDGAVVGEHSVTIINIDGPPPDSTQTAAAGSSTKPMPKFRRIPAPGNFQVVRGKGNRFDIKLTRQDVTRFAAKN